MDHEMEVLILQAMAAEGRFRKELSPAEKYALGKKLESLLATPVGRPPGEMVESFHHFEQGKTRDKIASALGISGKQWDKLKAVEEAEYDDLKTELERHGKVDRVFKKLQRRRRAEQACEETQSIRCTGLTCGDCREILPTFADDMFHATITDPPYGIGFEYDDGAEPCSDPDAYWEWFGPIYKEIVRVTKPGGLICLWQAYQYCDYFGRWFGKWEPFAACKANTRLYSNYPFTPAVDLLVMKWKSGAKPLIPTKQIRSLNWFVSDIQYGDDVHGLHPCPRPLVLCENLVRNFTIENGLILDCFAGAGTIPLAVQRVGGGRQFVAIEKNPKYCRVADQRLANS